MFLLVFRPHQRPAWCYRYNDEEDFIDSFQRDHFARTCNAECTGEDLDAMEGKTVGEAYKVAFERVGHDLSCLTRLDSAEEVERYLNECDYCGHHNKGYAAVEREALEIGWLFEKSNDDDHELDEDGELIHQFGKFEQARFTGNPVRHCQVPGCKAMSMDGDDDESEE